MPTPVDDLLARIDVTLINPRFLERVVEMLVACREAGADYWATSGYRSAADQDALYAKGRTAPGPIVTGARAFESAHNYGLAIDFTRDADPAAAGLQAAWAPADYDLLGQHAHEVELAWGGNFASADRPHVQLAGYVTGQQLQPLRTIFLEGADQGGGAGGRELAGLQAVWSYLDDQGGDTP